MYLLKKHTEKGFPQRERHQLYYTTYGLQLTVTESIPENWHGIYAKYVEAIS
jgi:hypothetical protein